MTLEDMKTYGLLLLLDYSETLHGNGPQWVTFDISEIVTDEGAPRQWEIIFATWIPLTWMNGFRYENSIPVIDQDDREASGLVDPPDIVWEAEASQWTSLGSLYTEDKAFIEELNKNPEALRWKYKEFLDEQG